MAHQEAIDVLVLDSGAFITGAKLDRFGPDVRYVTVKGVLDEIKDDAGRRNLEIFPYKIETRQVTAESMQAGQLFAICFLGACFCVALLCPCMCLLCSLCSERLRKEDGRSDLFVRSGFTGGRKLPAHSLG